MVWLECALQELILGRRDNANEDVQVPAQRKTDRLLQSETHAAGSRKPVWFALDDTRPLAFLTTERNAVVAPIHPKAMPVILDDGSCQGGTEAATTPAG